MERQGPVDIISNIPEEIQMQILSRLPRKDAIKTGVLSTAWNTLWTNWKNRFSYPTALEFNPPYLGEEMQGVRLKAEVERLQGYRNENKKIEKYKLDFNPGDEHEKSVMRMIRKTVSCGVEELELDFSQGFQSIYGSGGMLGFNRKRPEMKEKNFEGNSIAYLSLAYCRIPRTFQFTKFPRLHFLNFYGVNVNETILHYVLQNCGALETLVLIDCFQLKNVRIHFPLFQLKILIIEKCPRIDQIQVIAPNLRKFHFNGFLPERITIIGTRLEDVVWVSSTEINYANGNDFLPVFVTQSQIQKLSICNIGMQFLCGPRIFERLCPLHNLQVISFKMFIFWDNEIMEFYRFFNSLHLPRLETVNIDFPSSNENSTLPQPFNIIIQEEPPQMYFWNLLSIKMRNFDGQMQQFTLLSFFLSRAINLVSARLILPANFDLENLGYSLMNMVNQVARLRINHAEIIVETIDDRHFVLP